MRTAEVLSGVKPGDLETVELIAAKLVRAYLATMEQEEALKMMETVMADTVLNVDETVEIFGPQLAALINTAAVSMAGKCGEWMREKGLPAETTAMVLDVLHSIDGKLIVQNVSPEFLCFLAECYKALAQGA